MAWQHGGCAAGNTGRSEIAIHRDSLSQMLSNNEPSSATGYGDTRGQRKEDGNGMARSLEHMFGLSTVLFFEYVPII